MRWREKENRQAVEFTPLASDQVPTSAFATALAIASLVRVRQWPKNLLLFVPLFVSHNLNPDAIAAAAIGFAAFCFAASAGYVFNDLIDAHGDRQHWSRRHRPVASKAISQMVAWILIPVLLLIAGAFALMLPTGFGIVLALYIAGTAAYSLRLKRMLAIDVVVLGALYTARVLAGDEATGSDSSEWLIAFSMFFFLSLALVKRHTELALTVSAGNQRAINRSYREEDLRVLLPLAAAAGFSAVAILARYIGSTDVSQNFSQPERLWYVAPILIYWQMRLIFLANRSKLYEDPVMFAMLDVKSVICGLAIFAIILWAW